MADKQETKSVDRMTDLWQALNNHSTVMIGEWIDPEFEASDEEEFPPQPSDEAIIVAAIAYLKETI